MRVFLGGTCNDSLWRESLIPLLSINFFNPVVKNWNDEAYKEELHQREICDYCLYVITPKMQGVYSIAEAIDDSNKRPEKTIFACINDLDSDGNVLEFSNTQIKSLIATGKMVQNNGGLFFTSLFDIAEYLNTNGNR